MVRGQDTGWHASSFVVSRSRSRLEYLKFVASWSRTRSGYLKPCGFALKIPVGRPEVWWLRGQDPGWGTSSFVASRSRPRLKYLKFCVASQSRSPLGYLKFVSSWSGFRIGYRIPVGIPQVCGFRARSQLEYLKFVRLRGQDPGWDTSSFVASSRLDTSSLSCTVKIPVWAPDILWLRGQHPGRDTSSLWLRGQEPGWDASNVVALRSRSRLGYLEFVAS